MQLWNLWYLKMSDEVLQQEFVINKQKAESLGHTEMIDGIVAGIHYFCKQAGIYFKDINQRDECCIGELKAKIYTRDAMSDEDMLLYDSYFKAHPEMDIYILCKIKGGKYNYLGYITKEIAQKTRIVQMIGSDSDAASKDVRRIFAEQYLPLSNIIKIKAQEQEEQEQIESQDLIPLHMHSEFSVGDAFGTIKRICAKLKQKGFKAAALTDHGTMAGLWDFQKTMLENDLKPILGCEIYTKLDGVDKRFHTTVLIKNKIGWTNLLKLQASAVREHFHYKPVVPYKELLLNSDGLIITSGCMDGPIPYLLSKDKYDEADSLMTIIRNHTQEFYIEIMLHNILNYQALAQKLYNFSTKHHIKCILTTDTHYQDPEDVEAHEAIKAINFKKKYGEAGYGESIFYLLQKKDIESLIDSQAQWMKPYYKEFILNTQEVCDKVELNIIEPPKESDTLPKFLPTAEQRKEFLKDLCIKGLEQYTKYEYKGEIKERLDLEVNRILEKHYENYFLIVWDMIKWAKENEIAVGPGRGSVGGSLAAFSLNITDCDPIEHDLLFDRFLSPIRRDAPDVDMDFMDRRRSEIFDYLKNKYGAKNCAKVVTYSRFHPKGILRDIGRIFNIPLPEIERICGLVIERSGGDARASFSLQDTFEEYAEAIEFKKRYPKATELAIKLEGHIRHKGIHAAAMVVSESDISTYVPITKLSGEYITEWEKQLVEDMKLVKFDILGLKTLSVIHDAVKMSGCNLPSNFDDDFIYKNIFQKGNTAGVFQIETVGLTKLAQSIKVKSFNELYDTITLFRPGVLHSGQTQIYVNRAQNKESPEPFHELLRPITKHTKGIIMYQEQIMQIMNQVGGMSWATAEMARKVITKSKGKDAFNKMREEFVRNANRIHSMDLEEAERLYDLVSTFGSYGFNKSHAVEYSIISYWCAWLKFYYPKEFFTSILKNASDKSSIFSYMQDAKKNSISIEFPNINYSDLNYKIHKDKIYAGFASINGIASRTAEKIIKNQPYESFEDFKNRAKVSDKILKGLIVADCFRDFNINKKVCYNKSQKEDYNAYDDISEDWTDMEHTKLIYEETTLKPKIDIRETFNFGDYDFTDIIDLNEEKSNQQVLVRGIVTDKLNKDKLLRGELKEHTHKFEQHMIYINLNDGTGDVACQFGPDAYEMYSKELFNIEKKPIIVMGMTSRDGKKIYVDLIQIIGETSDIDDYFIKSRDCEGNTAIIASAHPGVSKKKNSYYRILLHNGQSGMCFKFTQKKIKPLQKVKYIINQEPFINLMILEE